MVLTVVLSFQFNDISQQFSKILVQLRFCLLRVTYLIFCSIKIKSLFFNRVMLDIYIV